MGNGRTAEAITHNGKATRISNGGKNFINSLVITFGLLSPWN